MAQVFGNRILGGIGAPESRAAEAFGAGVNTSIINRTNRQAMDERAQAMRLREEEAARLRQKFGWDTEDRARTAAAYDAFGAPAVGGAPAPAVPGARAGGMFAGPSVAPPGFRLGAPDQLNVPRPAGAPDLTFGLIRQFEGFRDTPYWDVNAFRTGFGSDTVTLSDGQVVPVRPGMRVTKEDAERDLSRRLNTEFIPRAAAQVGEQLWATLPEHISAPLASITYNYGSLPDSVVAAVRTGDPEQIAQAIEARAGDNGGINAARRRQEAAIVRSGGQIDPGLMRAAASPVGEAGVAPGPRQPDQSQRFRPADYAAALEAPTPDTGVRFNPDGTIALPTAPQGRPGDFAARGTAQRLADYTAGYAGLSTANPEFASVELDLAREELVNAEAAYVANPSSETFARATAARAEVNRLAPLVAGFISATQQYPNQRGTLALEGPAATGREAPMPTVAAGVTVPTPPAPPVLPVQQAGVDTLRPRARPDLTFQQSEDALIAAEQAAAEPTAPQQPAGVQVPTSPGVESPPAAGVTAPSVTTSDIRAGASVMTDTGSFPGLAALFQDTAMVGQEEAALAAREQALLRQMEFARQTRDAATLMEADGQLALIQARRTTLGYIKAGNAAMSGNFDPMAEVLSGMTGQTVRITPTGTGTYDVTVDGRVAQSGVDPQFMVQQYLYGVNEAYRAQVDAARAARVAQAAEQAKYAAEQTKIILEQTLQQEREVTVEQAKAIFASQAGTNPDLSTQTIQNPDNSTSILLFDKKNPNTPLSVIQLQTNPDGTVETVQTGVVDMRRNQ